MGSTIFDDWAGVLWEGVGRESKVSPHRRLNVAEEVDYGRWLCPVDASQKLEVDLGP